MKNLKLSQLIKSELNESMMNSIRGGASCSSSKCGSDTNKAVNETITVMRVNNPLPIKSETPNDTIPNDTIPKDSIP